MGMIVNQLKTVFLLGLLTGLLLWAGSFWGKQGLTIAIIFVGLMNFVTYFFSDKFVLAMTGAKPVPKSHWLYHLVHEVAQKAGLPTPAVYIIPTQTPNAFATGRNPKHAAVACTEGILKILSKAELRGVISHEISHVKNRDILVATVAATIAGVISYIANMAQWGLFMGNRDDRNGNILGVIALIIITPLVAMLIQFAISRSREYLADASGAHIIKDSRSLASALQKIHAGIAVHPQHTGNRALASLYIANPFKGESIVSLFSTHPPMNDRVKRLHEMKF
jgi:heat shock protein HtpX